MPARMVARCRLVRCRLARGRHEEGWAEVWQLLGRWLAGNGDPPLPCDTPSARYTPYHVTPLTILHPFPCDTPSACYTPHHATPVTRRPRQPPSRVGRLAPGIALAPARQHPAQRPIGLHRSGRQEADTWRLSECSLPRLLPAGQGCHGAGLPRGDGLPGRLRATRIRIPLRGE